MLTWQQILWWIAGVAAVLVAAGVIWHVWVRKRITRAEANSCMGTSAAYFREQEQIALEKRMQALDIMKKRRVQQAQYQRDEALDGAISREYWKNGGIRFFAEQLHRRLLNLSPDAAPEEMGVDLFNSTIMPVRLALEGLRKKQSEQVDALLTSDEELLEKLKTMDVDRYIRQHTAEPTAYVSRNASLLQSVTEVFEGDDASALAPDAGSDQATCHACAQQLQLRVEALLRDYPLPL